MTKRLMLDSVDASGAPPLVGGERGAPAVSPADIGVASPRASTTRRRARDVLALAVIGGATGWVLLTALPATGRAGYSADEEVTALVVSASSAGAVPTLPSGVVYLRGPLYVKLSEIAGTALFQDLRAYRVVSLMFGLANVLLIAAVAKVWLPSGAAPVAAVLLAASPVHAAASVFARPYTAAVFCLLAGCLIIRRALDARRDERSFLALALVSQAVHESAALLAVLPLAYGMVQGDPGARRRAWWLCGKTAAIAVFVQGVSAVWFSASLSSALGSVDRPMAVFVLRGIPWPPLALPALAGLPGIVAAVVLFGSLAVILRRAARLRGIDVFAGAVFGGLFLLGPLVVAMLLTAVVQPRRWRATVVALLTFGTASAVFWTVHTTLVTDAALTWHIGAELTRTALSYPLDWVFLLAQQFPATSTCMAIAGIAAARTGLPAWRFVTIAGGGLLTVFGLLSIAPHDRYLVLLLPFALLLAAAGIAVTGRLIQSMGAFLRAGALANGASTVAMCAVVIVIAIEQRAHAGRPGAEIEPVANRWAPDAYAPETYFANGGALDCLRSVPATDMLVCNDELACKYLAGRVDAWLLPDADIRRVCAVERGSVARGIYAGSRVLPDGEALSQLISGWSGRSVTVALLATPKFGYPEQVAIVGELARTSNVFVRPCGRDGSIVRFTR